MKQTTGKRPRMRWSVEVKKDLKILLGNLEVAELEEHRGNMLMKPRISRFSIATVVIKHEQ